MKSTLSILEYRMESLNSNWPVTSSLENKAYKKKIDYNNV